LGSFSDHLIKQLDAGGGDAVQAQGTAEEWLQPVPGFDHDKLPGPGFSGDFRAFDFHEEITGSDDLVSGDWAADKSHLYFTYTSSSGILKLGMDLKFAISH
jgi:hypothetical protein